MILADDNFVTIVEAVKTGRHIYANIKKAIHFLIATNIGEIVAIFFGLLLGLETPLLAIQLLWINLVTDSFPAIALGMEPAEKDIMNRKPNDSKKSIFADGLWEKIFVEGFMIGILTLIAYLVGLGTTTTSIDGLTLEETKVEVAQTMAFTVLAFSELIHVFNVRDNKNSIFKTGILGNPILIYAVLASAILMGIILVIPGLRTAFSIPILPVGNIVETVALIFAPIVIVEIIKFFKVNTAKDE